LAVRRATPFEIFKFFGDLIADDSSILTGRRIQKQLEKDPLSAKQCRTLFSIARGAGVDHARGGLLCSNDPLWPAAGALDRRILRGRQQWQRRPYNDSIAISAAGSKATSHQPPPSAARTPISLGAGGSLSADSNDRFVTIYRVNTAEIYMPSGLVQFQSARTALAAQQTV